MRALLPLLLSIACNTTLDAPHEVESQALVIHDVDDRMDVYEVSDPFLLNLAASTVMVMAADDMTPNAAGDWELDTSDTMRAQGICPSANFGGQVIPGFCSGVLVGPDLIATAGHCLTRAACPDTAFVFNFQMDSESDVRSTLPPDDVYVCSEVLERVNTNWLDWAIVRLDRPVTGHPIADVRLEGEPAVGDDLVLIGHPSGLPKKIAPGAEVKKLAGGSYFQANTDSFGGNSGSAVFNATTGEVEGLLVRGNTDYVRRREACTVADNGDGTCTSTCPSTGPVVYLDAEGDGCNDRAAERDCFVPYQCGANGCPDFLWEDIQRMTQAVGTAMATQTPSSCVDDAMEPNEFPPAVGSSASLLQGTHCPHNEDWHAIDVVAGDVIDLEFTAAGALTLEVWDNHRLLTQATGGAGAQTVQVSTISNRLLLRVVGDAVSSDYSVAIATAGTSARDFDLSLPLPLVAPGYLEWDIQTTGPSERYEMYYGQRGGTSPLPGCPGVTVPVGNALFLGATRGTGLVSDFRYMPLAAQGAMGAVVAVAPNSCRVSQVLDVSVR